MRDRFGSFGVERETQSNEGMAQLLSGSEARITCGKMDTKCVFVDEAKMQFLDRYRVVVPPAMPALAASGHEEVTVEKDGDIMEIASISSPKTVVEGPVSTPPTTVHYITLHTHTHLALISPKIYDAPSNSCRGFLFKKGARK